MAEAEPVPVKYVFVDVVSYSQGRSVEAQTEIIETLNGLVARATSDVAAVGATRIFLPTGDGICVVLINVEAPYDVHLQLALDLLDRLATYNSQTVDNMRKFQIRIGVNANIDNIVVDINGNKNVAGAGINLAQRIMNTADGNQILVGDAVFQTLRHREKYMNSFKSFTATAKHGVSFPVHQFIEPHPGLDFAEPSQLRPPKEEEPRLTRLAAYYFAHAIKNRESLRALNTRSHVSDPATVLLAQLAEDSVGFSEATEIDPYQPHTWKAGEASFDDQLKHYESIDFWVSAQLSSYIAEKHLTAYSKYFDSGGWPYFQEHFINAENREKLKLEWPIIWNEFGLDDTEQSV
jgi:class 3 adenylate cyclase